MKSKPLIFVHYGPSEYLGAVLAAARLSNPGKEIYFLGDESNQKFVPTGVSFLRLDDFRTGNLLEEFQSIFVPIAGRAHHFNKSGGVETWLRFVFERWFVILEFLRARAIESFWIFDSDTMIAGDLTERESRFAGLDATEQCGGCCLNGYISSVAVVEGYCRKMVDLYRRPEYLDFQRERLKIHSGLAFNEMDAWQTHRHEAGLHTLPLGVPCDGEAFDDALAITAGWQKSATKVRGRIPVKRLVRDRRGGYFAFREEDGEPIRLVTLNLSWLPDYVYRKLLPGCQPVANLPYDGAYMREVDFSEPLGVRLSRRTKEMAWAARSFMRRSSR